MKTDFRKHEALDYRTGQMVNVLDALSGDEGSWWVIICYLDSKPAVTLVTGLERQSRSSKAQRRVYGLQFNEHQRLINDISFDDHNQILGIIGPANIVAPEMPDLSKMPKLK